MLLEKQMRLLQRRLNAHIASRSFPPQICPFTCVNARRTRATKHVLEDLGGGSAPEAKAANRFHRAKKAGRVTPVDLNQYIKRLKKETWRPSSSI